MLRLADNPAVCFSAATGAESLEADEWRQHWYVVYTKPRQEKQFARDLRVAGVTYFLPMTERVFTSGGRRRKSLHPLFTGYVFFAGDEAARLSAIKTNRIVSFTDVSEPQQPTLQLELETLAAAIKVSPESIELHPRLLPGNRVIVRVGALKGFEGTVIDATNPRRLFLSVTALGTGITIELPADFVDPAN